MDVEFKRLGVLHRYWFETVSGTNKGVLKIHLNNEY